MIFAQNAPQAFGGQRSRNLDLGPGPWRGKEGARAGREGKGRGDTPVLQADRIPHVRQQNRAVHASRSSNARITVAY